MKLKWIMGLAVLGATSLLLAQSLPPAPTQGQRNQQPGGGPDGGGPPPGMQQDDGSGPSVEERMRQRRQQMSGQGGMGQGGPEGPRGPGGPGMRNPVEAMRAYIELVEKYTQLAKDPSSAGVSAVVTLTEIAKQESPAKAVERLVKLLDQTKDPTVKRAIRLQLIDLYRQTGDNEAAMVQAESLIRGE